MSNGKFAKRKGVATKTMFMILAVVLIVGISVGGTLAWLTATSGPVTNTFTTSDIDITLTETGATNNAKSFKMVPGYTINKDPKATVKAGSEDCYLFVKLEKSANFGNFMTYTIADGWTQLTKDKDNNDITDLIYYREVTASTSDQAFSVLKDDQVTVKYTVTKGDMEALTENTYPTLKVTAYASQLYKSNSTAADADNKFTPADAWDIVPKA